MQAGDGPPGGFDSRHSTHQSGIAHMRILHRASRITMCWSTDEGGNGDLQQGLNKRQITSI